MLSVPTSALTPPPAAPVIGWVYGPGPDPHTFVLLAADPRQQLKNGEYVTYQAKENGVPYTMFCRIIGRTAVRSYPPTFGADPQVAPDVVAHVLGYEPTQAERFALTATILGYYDPDLDAFVNPRLPPQAATPVSLAMGEELTAVLARKALHAPGSAHLGSLLSRAPGEVPLTVDVSALTSTHLAVIANTGAGKSYLAATLVEEMMMPYNRAALLIIDPHSEYHTLQEMAGHDAFAAANYRPQVQVIRHLTLHPGQLDLADLVYLLPDLSERMEYLLRKAFFAARQRSYDLYRSPDRWQRSDLIAELEKLGGLKGRSDAASKRDASTAEALIWRLESVLGRAGIFAEQSALKLSALFRPGLLSVLDVQEMSSKAQTILVAALLRQVLDARQRTVRGQVTTGSGYLPYPVFVLVEEAHRFAPAHETLVSSQVLKQVLAEGRKFGVGVGLISQRPGKLDADVLSQCNTQFLLRIVNPLDQAKVAEAVETVGRELLQELPALTRGQVIVAGAGVNTPVLLRGRKRYTIHGGQSLDAPQEWMRFNS